MRKLMFGLFAAAGIAAVPLQAQEELFNKLDANKDGFITLDEVDGEAKSKLERILRTSDKDEDKKLSKDEFAAGLKQPETPRTPVEGAEGRRPGGAPGQDAKEFFARADANKDGKLSKDEAPERLKGNFDRLDANKDGSIDAEEFARMLGRGAEGRGPDDPKAAEALFDRQDANSDGKLTKDEISEDRRATFQQMLDRLDDDGDGAVTKEQFVRAMVRMAQAGRPDGAPERRRPEGAPDRRPEGRPEAGRPEGRPGPGMMPLIRALDADGNGEVSADEIKNAAAALGKLDRNGDGKLTRDEMLPPPPRPGEGPPGEGRPGEGRPGEGRPPEGRPGEGRPGNRPNPEEMVRRVKEADANNDGKLSREEAPGFLKENFDRIDRNSDGSIDEAELRQLSERIRQGGPRGEGRPEGRRPDGERRRPEGEKPAPPKND